MKFLVLVLNVMILLMHGDVLSAGHKAKRQCNPCMIVTTGLAAALCGVWCTLGLTSRGVPDAQRDDSLMRHGHGQVTFGSWRVVCTDNPMERHILHAALSEDAAAVVYSEYCELSDRTCAVLLHLPTSESQEILKSDSFRKIQSGIDHELGCDQSVRNVQVVHGPDVVRVHVKRDSVVIETDKSEGRKYEK